MREKGMVPPEPTWTSWTGWESPGDVVFEQGWRVLVGGGSTLGSRRGVSCPRRQTSTQACALPPRPRGLFSDLLAPAATETRDKRPSPVPAHARLLATVPFRRSTGAEQLK
jgi:hypothetical protein